MGTDGTFLACSENNNTIFQRVVFENMAGTTRLELATSAVTVHCYLVTD
jgi:hypothetical protein